MEAKPLGRDDLPSVGIGQSVAPQPPRLAAADEQLVGVKRDAKSDARPLRALAGQERIVRADVRAERRKLRVDERGRPR